MTRADLSVLIPLMPLLDVHITVLGYALVSPGISPAPIILPHPSSKLSFIISNYHVF